MRAPARAPMRAPTRMMRARTPARIMRVGARAYRPQCVTNKSKTWKRSKEMPGRPMRVCSYPGCASLTDAKDGRCGQHLRKAWEKRPGPAPQRVRGATLQARRAALFRSNPLCVLCLLRNRVQLATQRDHIVPLAEGGQDIESNTQGLCKECHDLKSQEEARRGARRR